jgi:Sec-independent protein secretion pathway component TatC
VFWKRRCRRPEKIFVHFAVTSEQSSTQRRSHSQRGEGKLKAIVFTLVIIMAIYLAFKFVPPYVSEYQLQDKMQEQARFGIVNRYSEEQIRDNVFKVVQDLELPIKREDIKVSVSLATVKISLEYTVPVEMFFYSTELHFSPSSENKSLMQ